MAKPRREFKYSFQPVLNSKAHVWNMKHGRLLFLRPSPSPMLPPLPLCRLAFLYTILLLPDYDRLCDLCNMNSASHPSQTWLTVHIASYEAVEISIQFTWDSEVQATAQPPGDPQV